MTNDIDARIDAFWADADDTRPEEMWRALDALLQPLASDDPRVPFERASLHDFLGEEAQAIPLYRAALDGGLAGELRTFATIQLASSLRNVDDASGAMRLLQGVSADDPHADAAQAFLALAQYDDDKARVALRTALSALAGRLPAYRRAIEAYAADLAPLRRVRSIVVALVVRDGYVLCEEYPGLAGGAPFLRAPGGGIRFGEPAADAMRRELREELGVDADEVRLLGVTENIFADAAHPGHEIVHVFAVRSARLEALPLRARLPVLDADTTVGWYALDALAASDAPAFYPDGILDLARQLASPGSNPRI